jgi:hypothetical protein
MNLILRLFLISGMKLFPPDFKHVSLSQDLLKLSHLGSGQWFHVPQQREGCTPPLSRFRGHWLLRPKKSEALLPSCSAWAQRHSCNAHPRYFAVLRPLDRRLR